MSHWGRADVSTSELNAQLIENMQGARTAWRGLIVTRQLRCEVRTEVNHYVGRF
jgi:hypothetical protein